MGIDWQQLAQIEELQPYFEADFQGFQTQIEEYIRQLEQIEPGELDKLAILRVLEVTNGCTQWAFRRQDPECLSVEQTRECMRIVIGYIGDKRIDPPSGAPPIQFSPEIEALIEAGKELYRNAFKNNIAGARQDYFAYSAAQFLVYGRDRVAVAERWVRQEFEPLFTGYYINKGQNYVAPYLEAIE